MMYACTSNKIDDAIMVTCVGGSAAMQCMEILEFISVQSK